MDARDLSLDEWLHLTRNPPEDADFWVDVSFPTDEHREAYIASIQERDEEEIRHLLYLFLIKSGANARDEIALQGLVYNKKHNPETFQRQMRNQYFRRSILYARKHPHIRPWEGIPWVMDLLPHFPKDALQAISAYIMAHAQLVSEFQFHGLYDAMALIRAWCVGTPSQQIDKVSYLLDISPRDFEHLVERLYSHMGYETELTPAQKDGGRDVIAWKADTGERERLLIECKRYSDVIGVEIVRNLNGVVADEKANKGVLVSSARFTEDAYTFANRNPLELIDGSELVTLLNLHMGRQWPAHIDRHILDSKKAFP